MSGFLATGALLEDTGTLTASDTPIVLTPKSATILHLSGNGIMGEDQIVKLPDATKLYPGVRYYVANRSGVAAEIQTWNSQGFAKIEPGMQGEFRLLDASSSSGTWDAAIYPSVKAGTEDLNMTLLKGGTWQWSNGELSTTADAFVQVPGLPLSVNKIAKFPDYGVTQYTIAGDVAGSLNNKYIFLTRPDGTGYYLWLDVDGMGVDPGPFPSFTGIAVPVVSGASAQNVITALSNSITSSNANLYFSLTGSSNTTLTVTNKEVGKIILSDVSNVFSSSLINSGQNKIILPVEGYVAYTKIRRSESLATLGSPLTIEIASSPELLNASDADLWILAQNIGSNRALIANSFRLVDGQSDELYSAGGAKGSVIGSVQYNDGKDLLAGDNSFVWNPVQKILRLGDLYVTSLTPSITLLDDQDSPIQIAAFDPLTYKNLVLEYSLIRNGKPQMGQLLIVHDGVTASIADNFVAINSVGIEFLAGIDGSSLVLAYQSTPTGHNATLRYSMRYWS